MSAPIQELNKYAGIGSIGAIIIGLLGNLKKYNIQSPTPEILLNCSETEIIVALLLLRLKFFFEDWRLVRAGHQLSPRQIGRVVVGFLLWIIFIFASSFIDSNVSTFVLIDLIAILISTIWHLSAVLFRMYTIENEPLWIRTNCLYLACLLGFLANDDPCLKVFCAACALAAVVYDWIRSDTLRLAVQTVD